MTKHRQPIHARLRERASACSLCGVVIRTEIFQMVPFDEPSLRAALTALTSGLQAAFALACAERLRPYFGYPDSPPAPPQLDSALESLAATLRGDLPITAARASVAACEAALDVDDDAIAATIYALRTLASGQAQEAVWAARRGYEARDRLVLDTLDAEFVDADSETAVLAHPLVQEELQRQRRDLELLASPGDHVRTVLQRAREEGKARTAV